MVLKKGGPGWDGAGWRMVCARHLDIESLLYELSADCLLPPSTYYLLLTTYY